MAITVLAVNNFDYETLKFGGKMETKEALLNEDFNNININVDTIEIYLLRLQMLLVKSFMINVKHEF